LLITFQGILLGLKYNAYICHIIKTNYYGITQNIYGKGI
jgi:hypothetical protein